MNFEPSRAKALDRLESFVENNLTEYSKLRNFDFGPDKRSNVSCLSPYITHGIVNEQEIIKKSLGKFSFSKTDFDGPSYGIVYEFVFVIVFIFVFSKGIEVLTNTNSYTIPYDGPSKSVFEKWLPFSKDK